MIKVEPPGGDPAREIDPPMFARMAADKEVRVLDLKSDEGRAELHELAAAADVFFEGFRPGVAERLGAGWDTLSALNPGLVYCSLSGYGSDGPLAATPGHDINFLALAGGLPAPAPPGEALIRVPWVDLAAGTNAALAIVAALLERERSGRGRRLDVAMLDAAAVWSNAKAPRPGGEGAYGVFATADGERVAVAVLEEEMWRRLCAAFGWEEWLADPEFADHEARRASAERVTRAPARGAGGAAAGRDHRARRPPRPRHLAGQPARRGRRRSAAALARHLPRSGALAAARRGRGSPAL